MRKQLLLGILLCMVCLPARADDNGVLLLQGFDYYERRDASRISFRFSLSDLTDKPANFLGTLAELRGVVFAVGGSNGGSAVFFRPANGDQLLEIGLPANDSLDNWPFLSEGAEVRLLCRVTPDAASGKSLLSLETAVAEVEALAMEKLRVVQQRLAAEAAKQPNPAPAGPPGAFAPQLAATPLVEAYTAVIRQFRQSLQPAEAAQMAGWIVRYSKESNIDPRLVVAMVAQESGFNPRARSNRGAIGLGQLLPSTAREVGVRDPEDPEDNLRGSIRYLAQHLQRWSSSRPRTEAIQLALASYNAGAGAVSRYNGIPPYPETQNYVRTIMRTFQSMGSRLQ